MKKKRVIIVVLIAALLTAFLLKLKWAKEEAITLRVSYMQKAITLDSLTDIAEKQGYFEKNGVIIKKVLAEKVLEPLLMKKNADVALTTGVPALKGFLDNYKIKVLAIVNNYNPLLYSTSRFPVSRYPKKAVKMVRNVGISIHTSVIVPRHAVERLLFSILLQNMGVDIKQVSFVEIPQESARAAALLRGELDLAFFGSEKIRDQLKELGDFTVLEPREIFKDLYVPSEIVITEKALKEKPEAAKRFVKSIYQAMQYVDGNKKEAIAYFKEKHGLSQKQAGILYQSLVESRANLDYVPSEDNMADFLEAAIEETKPKNPDRELNQFFFKDYAKAAIE